MQSQVIVSLLCLAKRDDLFQMFIHPHVHLTAHLDGPMLITPTTFCLALCSLPCVLLERQHLACCCSLGRLWGPPQHDHHSLLFPHGKEADTKENCVQSAAYRAPYPLCPSLVTQVHTCVATTCQCCPPLPFILPTLLVNCRPSRHRGAANHDKCLLALSQLAERVC